MYVGVTFLYVTLFSSNICMLVIYVFYVTQQTYICYCSPSHMLLKKSHNMHMFFSLVCSASGPIWTLRHGIQVHIVTMGSYKFYGWVSWSCFNCVITERLRVTVNPQIEVAWQPGKQVWVTVLISQQPTQRDKRCVRMHFTQKHIVLIHVRHHVSIFECLFFVPCLQQRSETNGEVVWPCKLPIDSLPMQQLASSPALMSCLSNTPWVFFWVQSQASSRLTA